MIGKLKGRIDSTDDDSLIVDVAGVGYSVFASTRTLAALPGVGEAIELIIETHVREDHIHLFGFPNAVERDCFRMLTTVQGVGVKMALAILGVFSPAQLANTILAKDMKSLTRVSGVGNKLAERLTIELKNKVGGMPTGVAEVAGKKGGKSMSLPAPTASEDAISALIHLGYSRSEAYNAVTQAAVGAEDDKVDTLIKESLRKLAR